MTPIYDNRTIVGYAETPKQAVRVLKRLLQTVPPNWKITVKERDTAIIDLPAGFIYSVHP